MGWVLIEWNENEIFKQQKCAKIYDQYKCITCPHFIKQANRSDYLVSWVSSRTKYPWVPIPCTTPPLGASWSPQNHSYPEKMFPSNVLISLEAEKNPLSLIENPHKSPFRKFFYDHLKVELFSFLCSNFYKKILSITRQRKDATAVAQLTLFLNARVSYHKCHTHNKLDAFWYRFTKQVLKFIRCSVCLANWYRKIQLTFILV